MFSLLDWYWGLIEVPELTTLFAFLPDHHERELKWAWNASQARAVITWKVLGNGEYYKQLRSHKVTKASAKVQALLTRETCLKTNLIYNVLRY